MAVKWPKKVCEYDAIAVEDNIAHIVLENVQIGGARKKCPKKITAERKCGNRQELFWQDIKK